MTIPWFGGGREPHTTGSWLIKHIRCIPEIFESRFSTFCIHKLTLLDKYIPLCNFLCRVTVLSCKFSLDCWTGSMILVFSFPLYSMIDELWRLTLVCCSRQIKSFLITFAICKFFHLNWKFQGAQHKSCMEFAQFIISINAKVWYPNRSNSDFPQVPAVPYNFSFACGRSHISFRFSRREPWKYYR